MIPTMIFFGLVFGRWWRYALPLAAVVWCVALVSDGAMGLEPELFGAALLASANAAVGVAVHQLALHAVRWLRKLARHGTQAAHGS